MMLGANSQPTTHNSQLPTHIAIIMDGNGRWAKERGKARRVGHQAGAKALKSLLQESAQLGVKCLTVYAFSAENWGRPKAEVAALMGLLAAYIDKESALLHQHRIRFRVIGDISALEPKLQRDISALIEATREYDAFHFTLALNYGAKQELLRAVNLCAVQGRVPIDEAALEAQLYTADLPPLDLLIRTGGDHRLSNFLLWQAAYAELYFCDEYWPDFNAEHLQKAIDCFASRERRYGKL